VNGSRGWGKTVWEGSLKLGGLEAGRRALGESPRAAKKGDSQPRPMASLINRDLGMAAYGSPRFFHTFQFSVFAHAHFDTGCYCYRVAPLMLVSGSTSVDTPAAVITSRSTAAVGAES
jgi:hypothetical protein